MVKTKEITLLAWNVQDGLSDPERADAIAEKIADIDPDLALLSEGTVEGYAVKRSARQLLEEHTGNVYEADYADIDGRPDRHRLVAVAKEEFGEPVVLSNFGRNGFYFNPEKLPIQIAGLQAYDRDYQDVGLSDDARRRQVRHVLSRLALDIDTQAIVMGDLGSMSPEDTRARAIRLASPLLTKLPYKDSTRAETLLDRVGNISHRLAQMAIGGPLEELKRARFHSADMRHHPTSRVGVVQVQRDHIMAKRSEISHHTLHDYEHLSEHSAVSVRARIFPRGGVHL